MHLSQYMLNYVSFLIVRLQEPLNDVDTPFLFEWPVLACILFFAKCQQYAVCMRGLRYDKTVVTKLFALKSRV